MSRLIPKAERDMLAECDRFMNAAADIIDRNPEYRSHLAYALLGNAVAYCDSYGCSAEDFIAELRRTHDKPPVLVPPMMRRS